MAGMRLMLLKRTQGDKRGDGGEEAWGAKRNLESERHLSLGPEKQRLSCTDRNVAGGRVVLGCSLPVWETLLE